ncbi:MAG: hypothetical protein ACREQL_09115 [Candidatus Binatia bacterium]
MAKTTPRKPLAKVRASVRRVRSEGEHMVNRLRRDAQTLIARSRTEVLKDVRAVRKDLQHRADHAVRELERRVVKQFHAATEEQVRRIERRVAKLEQLVAGLAPKPTASGEKAA